MNDEQLAKHFGWWWRNKSILDDIGPQLQRVAFCYELAARAEKGKKPGYLLRKRFDKLTEAQKYEAAKCWPSRPQRIEAFCDLRFVHEPFEPEKLERELRQIRSGWIDDRRMTRREKQAREKFERAYAKERGWTLPQYFTFNLRQCGNTPILTELKKWLERERERLGIEAPEPNEGRANRSSKRKSFRDIEALDVRRNLSHSDAAQDVYDTTGGQAREAARDAKRLRREGEANLREWLEL
jgi:hypothetical protein